MAINYRPQQRKKKSTKQTPTRPTRQHPHPLPQNPPEPPPRTHRFTHKFTHIDTILNPAIHSWTTLTHHSTLTKPQPTEADESNWRWLFNCTTTHSPVMPTNPTTHWRRSTYTTTITTTPQPEAGKKKKKATK